jgi:hypothetical protein
MARRESKTVQNPKPGRAWPPKAQQIYINQETGEIVTFDSWSAWPHTGIYRLSSGEFVRLATRSMRLPSEGEAQHFARAKRVKVEAMANV